MEIKNKVIIVTGASQGIGLATAKHLAKLGAKVVAAARTIDKVELDAFKVQTDLRKKKDISNLIKKTIDKFGRIDILINNAGQGTIGSVESMNIEYFKQIMELNVYSVIETMQEVTPIMKKQGSGMIVNISSQVSKHYYQSLAAYSATKYALNAVSLIARQELEKDNIVVSLVHPKMTKTNFMQNIVGEHDWGTSMSGDSPELVAKKVEEIIKSEEAEILV